MYELIVGGVVALQLIILRLVQPENAYDPIEVTPSGMVIEVRLVQFKNVVDPI